MKKFTPKGTFTALVTPFKAAKGNNKGGDVDFNALQKLIEFQVDNGVDGIVVCGTTGEAATLTEKEKIAIITQAVKFAEGKVHIIVGTGTYETEATLNLTTIAKELGASAALIVAPYYTKPTQQGLFEHYSLVASNVDIPIILYNVPGRTGVNITAGTQLALANANSNVVATKEASGNFEQIMTILRDAPDHFSVLSGDDSITLPMMSLGAKGVVSVISNYAPKEFSDMVNLCLKGKYADASKIHYNLLELMNLNFVEASPAPAKAALAIMGMVKEVLRLPMMDMTKDGYKMMKSAMAKAGLIK